MGSWVQLDWPKDTGVRWINLPSSCGPISLVFSDFETFRTFLTFSRWGLFYKVNGKVTNPDITKDRIYNFFHRLKKGSTIKRSEMF